MIGDGKMTLTVDSNTGFPFQILSHSCGSGTESLGSRLLSMCMATAQRREME